jgi:hypothetical protein
MYAAPASAPAAWCRAGVPTQQPCHLACSVVALEHPALSSKQQVLCAAACVCRDWRQAVQQCGIRNTHVQLNLGRAGGIGGSATADVLYSLASFSSWLSKHSALVSSMAISHWSAGRCGCSWETIAAVNAAAAQLLRPAMHLAAVSSSVTATVPTATREAAASVAGQDRQQPHQQLPGLRLDSFSSDAATACCCLGPP